MSTKTTLAGALVVAALALSGCAGSASASLETSRNPEADAMAYTASAPTKYAYQYDRDGDGSYAQPHTRAGADPEHAPESMGDPVFTVDNELHRICEAAEPTYFFAFDSADLPERATKNTENLVRCLNQGALEQRTIEVIGHADDRGSDDYNLALGRDRADTVASRLIDAGLDRDRITVRSAGEVYADEPSDWDDRRVVIRLR